MLALIAEQVTGQSFSQLVHSCIVQPLSLASVRVVIPKDEKDSLVPSFDGGGNGIARVSTTFGAGEISGSPKDMLVFCGLFWVMS